VYTDITELRRQEQQVQVLNRILRHNLRNKVNIIQGHASRLQDTLDGIEAESAATIVEAARSFSELTEKATLLRKANRQDIASADANAVDLIEDVAATIQDEYTNATVNTDLPDEADVVGAGLLRIALQEVIENAVEHAENPEPKVHVTVLPTGPDNRWTKIVITDDGPGIPEMEQEVLESGLETPLQHGSSLGLWVVNWILKSLSGDFIIETPDEGGTRITFKVPIRSVQVEDDLGISFAHPER
jgi:signal transduction histidine kinase